MFDAGDDLIIDDLPRAAPQLLERPPAVLRYGEHLFIARVDHIGGNMKPVELAKDVVAGALGQVGAARQPGRASKPSGIGSIAPRAISMARWRARAKARSDNGTTAVT